jgi:hypothetical protein
MKKKGEGITLRCPVNELFVLAQFKQSVNGCTRYDTEGRIHLLQRSQNNGVFYQRWNM